MVLLILSYLQWRQILSKKLKYDSETDINRKLKRTSCEIAFCYVLSWVFFSAIVFGSFAICYMLDDNDAQYLVHTRYSTIFVLFLTLLVEEYLRRNTDAANRLMETDIYKLCIHQLKLELSHLLKRDGMGDRADLLEKFLQENKMFSLKGYGFSTGCFENNMSISDDSADLKIVTPIGIVDASTPKAQTVTFPDQPCENHLTVAKEGELGSSGMVFHNNKVAPFYPLSTTLYQVKSLFYLILSNFERLKHRPFT